MLLVCVRVLHWIDRFRMVGSIRLFDVSFLHWPGAAYAGAGVGSREGCGIAVVRESGRCGP